VRAAGKHSPVADGKHESQTERLDRELIELLNELRVALPGVQVLFAFLLTIPFTGGFGRLSEVQRDVYFGTFLGTIAATAFLMTPTAFHRLRWRRYDKERMLQVGNRTAILGLSCLAISICGAAYLIADVLFGTGGAAATVLAAAALIGGLWFVLPLTRQIKDDEPNPD
jgi:high-affinity Fe2+/Pb2+ permease